MSTKIISRAINGSVDNWSKVENPKPKPAADEESTTIPYVKAVEFSTRLMDLLSGIIGQVHCADIAPPLVLTAAQDELVMRWLERLAVLQLLGNFSENQFRHWHALFASRLQTSHPRLHYAQLVAVVPQFEVFFRRTPIMGRPRMINTAMMYVAALYQIHTALTADEQELGSNRAICLRRLDVAFAANGVAYMNAMLTMRMSARIHGDMLRRVQSPRGFETLARTLLQITDLSHIADDVVRTRSDVIVSLCARPRHRAAFYASVREQCEELLARSRRATNDERHFAWICMDTLMELHALPEAQQAAAIERHVFGVLRALAEPGDILAGRIVLEHEEFVDGLRLVHEAFLRSVRYRLPSRLLSEWLPLLLGLHVQLSGIVADAQAQASAPQASGTTSAVLRNYTGALITYRLANAPDEAFGELIDLLLTQGLSAPAVTDATVDNAAAAERPAYRWLHGRIGICISQARRHTCRIVAATSGDDDDVAGDDAMVNSSTALIDVLRRSQDNILIYRVFLHLLRQLCKCYTAVDGQQAELLTTALDDDRDVERIVMHVYQRPLLLIDSLQMLITFRPIHCQFNENPGAALDCITQLLRERVARLRATPRQRQRPGGMAMESATMLVLLHVVKEFVAILQRRLEVSGLREFDALLAEYEALSADAEERFMVRAIRAMLGGEAAKPKPADESVKSDFETARLLCTSNEVHIKACGLQMLRHMVETGTDVEVLAHRHAVLMVALDALAHEDSYVYLGSVKLLAALDKLLDVELIETIVAEYHLQDATVDYRLKVGEALVKLTEELGPMAYKYKNELIRCFLVGSRSENELLRMSSLSSLASLVRLFAYTVHAFFQELHDLALYVIVHDDSVLCRRAAVMMISHLFVGFDKLLEFQGMLLPLYRALKHVRQTETDAETLIHAGMGLEALAKHVKEFMTVERKPKEIRIFDINPPTASSRKKSILEIL